jgi:two-component system, NarL family, nitrate/nitrite response regulator NarL
MDGLTRRERELVAALLDGRSNKELATQFGVSEQTIKNQLTTLYKKYGVKSRASLRLAVTRDRRRT